MKSGDQVDRYVIESELGKGGMGEVFEAFDTKLARKVALKIVAAHEDPTVTQRTLREARAAAAFQHPNAVVVYDVGEIEGATFIAMELVRGKTLRRFIGGDVPLGRKVRWLVDIAAALAAAHDAGLVHRDVKPDNVLIRDDGAVKVLDFGIAKRPAKMVDASAPTESDVIPTLTERGLVVGTPLYASPEQLRGEGVDARSDQFSWGVVAYELLSGKVPWKSGGGDVLVVLSQILTVHQAPLSDEIPAEVRAVVERALAKDAADRFADMAAASEPLEPFASAPAALRHGSLSDVSTRAATPPPTQVARIARRTGRIVYTGLAVIGGLLVAAIIAGAVMGTLQFDLRKEHTGVSAAAAASGEVASLACAEATVEGDEATPLMKRAIGFGACARLAIELDVDWLLEGGQSPLVVKSKLGKDGDEVTLSVAGKSATGRGKTPVDAMNAATAELAKQVKAVPPSVDRIKAWGAKDAASAIRIERVWRRLILNLEPNHVVAIRAVLASDPDSAFSHFFAGLTFERGGAEQIAESKKAIALADSLPPSRALGVKGILELVESPDLEKSALEQLRRSYDQAPSDADIAGLFAAAAIAVGDDEGWSVLDRLVAAAPTKSIVPLQNAITAPRDRDLERDERYLHKLESILPETGGWNYSVVHLAQKGQLAEAKKALAFGDRFGLAVGDASSVAETRVLIGLVAEDPKEVRAAAATMLGDPRPDVASFGARAMVQADFLDGKLDDALERDHQRIERLGSHAGPQQIANAVAAYSIQLRQLGKKPADAALVALGRASLDKAKLVGPAGRFELRGWLAIAGVEDPKKAKAELVAALAEIDKVAAAAPNRHARESARLAGLGLVRIVKGDAEAAKIWRETPRANRHARDAGALEAALALDDSGARDEAIEVYREVAGPFGAEDPLSKMIARVRLAELFKKAGEVERAAEQEAVLAARWKDVDRAVLDHIKAL